MDTIDGMRTFVAVISEGSFSAAAGRLDMSPQLVSKYVGQLEARLGARLLNRSTRRLSITEAGQAYYERCRYILDEIDEMEKPIPSDVYSKATITTANHNQDPNIGTRSSKITSSVSAQSGKCSGSNVTSPTCRISQAATA